MKITYDLEFLPEKRATNVGSEELQAVKAFLAGKQKNMCIEYDDEKMAKRRYDTIRGFRNVHKLQAVFDIYRRETHIYIVRLKKSSGKQEAFIGKDS